MNIKEIAVIIKERREILNIDQLALAEISEVSVHTLSNIESGIGNPRIETLNKIFDVLGYRFKIELKSVAGYE